MGDFQVLAEDCEYRSFLSKFYVVFMTIWMIGMPSLLVLLVFSPGASWRGVQVLAYLLVLLGVLYLGRTLFRVRLVLDLERQEVLLHRKRLGLFDSYRPLATAEALWGTTWSGELTQAPFTWWWNYAALLVTRDGQRFRCFEHTDWVEADRHAQELAETLGLEFRPGQEKRLSRIRPGPEFTFWSVPVQALDVFCLLYWGVMLFPGLSLTFAGLVGPFPH